MALTQTQKDTDGVRRRVAQNCVQHHFGEPSDHVLALFLARGRQEVTNVLQQVDHSFLRSTRIE